MSRLEYSGPNSIKERMSKREPTAVKDPANPVQFGPPIVHPGVNPAAVRTAMAMQGRHPQKYAVPVAGGPTPPIPNLEGLAGSGLTMADQALAQRMPAFGTATPAQKGGIFIESPAIAAAATFQPSAGPARPPAFYPSDLLPNDARQDPAFRDGGASMYAVSQPELAYKYGVIRGSGPNRRHVPPQELNHATKGLKPETVADLRRLTELQNNNPVAEQDREAEQAAAAGPAGAAGRFGNTPGDGPEASGKARVEEAIKKMDDLDFSTLRDMMLKDIINNDDQRKIIEDRCEPMKVDDIIMQGFVRQKVPVLPGKFEVTFQSPGGIDDLEIKRLIMVESKGLEINERYLLDKFSLMTVVLGTYAINNNILPGYTDPNGKFSEEKFWEKYHLLAKYSFHMLSSLGVNFFWFDIRVRRLFVAERLGNG